MTSELLKETTRPTMKIAFIQQDDYEKMGVQQLCGTLRNRNIEYDIFIETLETDFYGAVHNFNPNLILFSLYIGEQDFMLKAFTELKKLLPNVTTLVGGPFTLVFPEIVQSPQVDYAIRGDGENSLPLFLEHFKQGHAPNDVPGICFTDDDGVLRTNEKIDLIADLTTLPEPDRDIYYKYPELKNSSKKDFIASRGCPFNCSYCYSAEIKKFYHHSYWRLRDQEAVLKEIEYVQRTYGLKWVHFQDGTFNANHRWLKSFLIEYRKRRLPPFLCNCRVENFDDELAGLLKEAGCDRITFGIQSGNPEIRNGIARRNMSNDQIEAAFALCHKYRIRVGADVIFGWPGETLDQAMDTIRLCRKLKAGTFHSNVLIPYPGLSITRYAIGKGFMATDPSLDDISGLKTNRSLIRQNNINVLINLDKLFYFIIRFPKLEGLFKMMLRLPPNRIYSLLKNLHLLKRSLKYQTSGIAATGRTLVSYLKAQWTS